MIKDQIQSCLRACSTFADILIVLHKNFLGQFEQFEFDSAVGIHKVTTVSRFSAQSF